MANDLQWGPQVHGEGVVRAPYGAAVTVPIDETDVAEVAVAALRDAGTNGDGGTAGPHVGHTHHLTGPGALTPVERVSILAAVLGRSLRFEEQDPKEAQRQMEAAGVPTVVADSLLAMLARRVGARPEVSNAVLRLTGHPPRTYREWALRHRGEFA